MKATIPYKMSNAQKKAAEREIDRQIIERQHEWDCAYEAMIMWALREYAGWGKKKLLDFREHFMKEYDNLCSRYQIGGEYAAMSKLKDIGYDVKELIENDKNK